MIQCDSSSLDQQIRPRADPYRFRMDVPENLEVKMELNEEEASIPFCAFAWGERTDNQPGIANDYHQHLVNICKIEKNELYSKAVKDSEFSSPVEVKMELNEEGTSIPFCAFAWGGTSDYQPGIANDCHRQQVNIFKIEKNEDYSEVEIKQEPDMDSYSSTTKPITLDIDKQTVNQSGLCQPLGMGQSSVIKNIPGSKTNNEIPEVTACPVTKVPTCVHCPEMKFVSETHLLAHNIDKHGFQVPSDLENTNKNQLSVVELSVNCSGNDSPTHSFSPSSNPVLASSLRTHPENKPFQCRMCDYKCSQKQDLTKHTKNHTEVKRFQCTMCNFKCRLKSVLTKHSRIHTGEKRFQCTVCDYKCTERKDLKYHQRVHTGEKPFQCTMCNFKCNHRSNLSVHMRTHTGEKPFHCTMCNFKFSEKQNLTRHIRIHTNEKPFQCTICDYKSNQKSVLKYHLGTHTGKKPFQCTLCDYECRKKKELQYHLRTHGFELQPGKVS